MRHGPEDAQLVQRDIRPFADLARLLPLRLLCQRQLCCGVEIERVVIGLQSMRLLISAKATARRRSWPAIPYIGAQPVRLALYCTGVSPSTVRKSVMKCCWLE